MNDPETQSPQSFLWGNFFQRDPEKDIFTLLRGVPIFEGLSRSDLKAVERILHRRKYHAGEYIFREGDPGLGMYIIEKGEVSIVSESRSTEISRLGKGEFFGEMALFNERPRSASALAYEDTKCFGFFQPDLSGLLETRPRIGVKVVAKLASILAERLYKANAENVRLISRLALKDMP
ncbi:MAG: cyclic nucleotide-binding domain-containing protein [Bacteroidetes bacterium]|nr:cyclic nucleotide-binding domain-containing protein [Bacteroidota bacterium]